MKVKVPGPAVQLCECMKRIYNQDMTSLTGGNLSVLDEEGVIWVTPSGIDKGGLCPEDIVRILPDGRTEGKYKPTSEYQIHKAIYEACLETKAVLHAHSPGMVTMSALRKPLNPLLLADAWRVCPSMGLAPYRTPGTSELAEAVKKEFQAGYSFVILENHAAFLGSVNLAAGFLVLEQMEFLARMQFNAQLLGKLLPADVKAVQRYVLESRKKVFSPSEIRNEGSEMREEKQRKQLKSFSERSYKKKLFTAGSGALSVRLGEDKFLITPEGKDRGNFEKDDFVCVDQGKCKAGKLPDRDWKLHREVYKKHPEVNCIMFAAPCGIGAYALNDACFPVELAPEVYGVLRSFQKITLESFFDSEKTTEKISGKTPFLVVQNLGVFVAGPDLPLTFDKMEVAESAAQSLILASMAEEKICTLTREQLMLTDKN